MPLNKNQRLERLFSQGKKDLLSLYFTAGYPKLEDTVPILQEMERAGVDLVEIGMPYSDPLADGPTIQKSSEVAIRNGMSLDLLLGQVAQARKSVRLPIVYMGYYNPILQFGPERFLKRATEAGIDAVILPDLPLEVFETEYQELFAEYGMGISFLISPRSPDARIRKAAALSTAFVYMVAASATTGTNHGISDAQIRYFERIAGLKLDKARLIGFGISSPESFRSACQYANGAIIGSAFIKELAQADDLSTSIQDFIQYIRS